MEITRPTYDLSLIQKHYTAQPGGRGRTFRGKGHLGEDAIIPVPKGTVVTDIPNPGNANGAHEMDSEDQQEELYIDTSHPALPIGTRFLVATGGIGGFGIHYFIS